MTDNSQAYRRAMTLAALSGFKIALGPAFLAMAERRPSARNWVLGAIGEMVLDKVGVFPPRYRPSLLLPHTLAGAWVARESLKADGVDEPMGAVLGAAVAAGVAIAAPLVRMAAHKVTGIPDAVLGVAEDCVALRLGSQATGMALDHVKDVARESVEDAGHRVRPALRSAGLRV